MKNIKMILIVKNDVIKKVYETDTDLKTFLSSINCQDDYIIVPRETLAREGMNVNEFDKNWKLKPVSERLEYIKLPENYTYDIDLDIVRPLTLSERVIQGKIILKPHEKIINNNGNEYIGNKSDEEMISEGLKTSEEIAFKNNKIENEKLIQEEIRKIAIERLSGKLKPEE